MTQASPIAFITGCSSGIGLATAKLLKARGWQVYAGVRQDKDAVRLQSLGFCPIQCDLNDDHSIQHAVDTLRHATDDRCDALINNAGYAQPGAVEDIHPDALRKQFQTNVFGLHALTQKLLPTMRRQGHGRIVMISSILGLVSLPYRGAYNASKHALEALSAALRMELHGTGIHISVIQPGPIASDFRHNAWQAFQADTLKADPQHQAHYEAWAAHFHHKPKARFVMPADAVAQKCWQAVSARRPKLYYKVTVPAYLLSFMQNTLPARWLDRLFRAKVF